MLSTKQVGFHGHPLRKDFPLEGIDTGAAIYAQALRFESKHTVIP